MPEPIAGSFEHADSAPWGLDGWCDACFKAKRQGSWNQWNQAVREGRFKPAPACQDCDKKVKLVAHHLNYLKPFLVRWLCPNCHTKAHREAVKEYVRSHSVEEEPDSDT